MEKKLQFKDLVFGKEYIMFHKGLAFPLGKYSAKVKYNDGENITLEVKLIGNVLGSFGNSLPYTVGITEKDLGTETPIVEIYEN